jgi:hypothetical protein
MIAINETLCIHPIIYVKNTLQHNTDVVIGLAYGS